MIASNLTLPTPLSLGFKALGWRPIFKLILVWPLLFAHMILKPTPTSPPYTNPRGRLTTSYEVVTYLWLENWLGVAETGPIRDSRSRSSPSPWGFWELQTTFLMNPNTKETALRTFVIYCPTPRREQPVESAATYPRAKGRTRPQG